MGWEPNPKHEEYLLSMAEAYNSCGYNTIFYTRTGVGSRNTVSQLLETVDDQRDWGAHFVAATSNNSVSKPEYRVGLN